MKNICALILFTVASNAWAEIYKSIDAEGHITYSNLKSNSVHQLEIDSNASVIGKPSSNKRSVLTDSYSKVDKDTQRQRDMKRQEILLNELSAEQSSLVQAKKAYAEGVENTEVFKTPGGSAKHNASKFQEKIQALQEEVSSHQKNVELLQKEINARH